MARPVSWWLLALAALGGACAELPELEVGACGNGVVEGGEDCDLFADSALGEGLTCGDQCRYVCDPTAPMPACPAGWACGRDRVCRFGASAFELTEASPLAFPTGHQLLLGDLDADGTTDVVGGDEATVEVRFGSASGTLREPFTLRTDFPTGPRSLTAMGATSQLALMSPGAAGVGVFLGDPARFLLPVGLPSSALPGELTASSTIAITAIRRPGRPVDDFLVVVPNEMGLAFLAVDPGQPPPEVTVEPRRDRPGTALTPVTPGVLPNGRRAAVVALEGDRRVYVVGIDCNGNPDCGPGERRRANVLAEVTLLGAVLEGARLVDIDGDGQSELLVSVERPGGRRLLAIPWRQGAFDVPGALTLDDCDDTQVCLPLAVGDLDGDGRAELVFPDRIATATSSEARLVDVRTFRRPATQAVVADFNGDGHRDVAAVTEQALIEVFATAGSVFNTSIYDVGGPVAHLRAGDFDGNGVADLAIVQHKQAAIIGGRRAVSDISVLFGAPGATLADPELMARFDPIAQLTAGLLPGAELDDDDAITDAIVVTKFGALGIMRGTTQRTLHSPLALPGTRLNARVRPVAVLGFDIDGDGGRDLAAFGSATGAGSVTLDVLPEGEGLDPYDLSFEATLLARPDTCFTPDVVGGGQLQVSAGRLGTRGDLLIVNRDVDCRATGSALALTLVDLTLRPDQSLPQDRLEPACTALDVTAVQSWQCPSEPRFADVDGDGRAEAMVLFRGRADAVGPRGLALWTGPEATPAVLSLPADRPVYDFALVDADLDPDLELAVLTEDGVYLVDRVDGAFVRPDRPIIPAPLELGSGRWRLGAADLDADGLTDLLVGTESRLYIYKSQQAWLGGPEPDPSAP